MSDETEIDASRLYFPGLAGLYKKFAPYSYDFIRFSTGAVLFPHGVQKFFFGTMSATAGGIEKAGIPFPMAWAFSAGVIEFVFAGGLALGLFTRISALVIWAEMTSIIFYFNWANGYFWTQRGVEYALLWWLLCIAIFFRGGGKLSLDRLRGREF